nr:hypothetical protein [Kofleriaceae bacterium]
MKSAVVAAALAALAAVACGSSSPPPAAPAPPPQASAGDPTCPVEVAGTSATVEDATRGAAFVFVTTGDVAAVRDRARSLAAAHDKHDGPAGSLATMIGVGATAAEADIEHGAKVTFTAVKDDDASALQSELRMHAQHLASGTCKMAM